MILRWSALHRSVTCLCAGLVLLFALPVGAADYTVAEYRAAVEDAREALPSEISKNLWAITPDNPDIIWEGAPGASRVLVVTWTGTYYDESVGSDYQLTHGPLWVTPAEQLKQWFESRNLVPTVQRVEQLLGLPLESGSTRFVEIWVDPAQLFRPSADPEVSDSEAELQYPSGFGVSVSQPYKDWFEYTKANKYSDPYPYPWTRLGYTYDWGNQYDHVGLSEFVVAVKITDEEEKPWVGVHKVYTNEEYFQTVHTDSDSDSSDFPNNCFINTLH